MDDELKKARERIRQARVKQKAKLKRAKAEARAVIAKAKRDASVPSDDSWDNWCSPFDDEIKDATSWAAKMHEDALKVQEDILKTFQAQWGKALSPKGKWDKLTGLEGINTAVAAKVFRKKKKKATKEKPATTPEQYSQDYRGGGMIDHVKSLEEENKALQAEIKKVKSSYAGKRDAFLIALLTTVILGLTLALILL